jgi:hypothetical protein
MHENRAGCNYLMGANYHNVAHPKIAATYSTNQRNQNKSCRLQPALGNEILIRRVQARHDYVGSRNYTRSSCIASQTDCSWELEHERLKVCRKLSNRNEAHVASILDIKVQVNSNNSQ